MDAAEQLEVIGIEGERLLAAARGNLGAAVPTCPGWTVADLLAHIGRVHRSVHEHVVRRATEVVPGSEIPRPPDGDAVVGFAEEGLAQLLETLGSADPAMPVWTWSDQHEVAFFLRRMMHENTIHRVDAELAAGGPVTPVDGAVAVDGIDELYETVLPWGLVTYPRPLPTGSLHLHRTDGEGEWMLIAADGSIVMSHEHGKGDAAVRGPGHDLYLAVWGRAPLDGLESFGDPGVAVAWVELSP